MSRTILIKLEIITFNEFSIEKFSSEEKRSTAESFFYKFASLPYWISTLAKNFSSFVKRKINELPVALNYELVCIIIFLFEHPFSIRNGFVAFAVLNERSQNTSLIKKENWRNYENWNWKFSKGFLIKDLRNIRRGERLRFSSKIVSGNFTKSFSPPSFFIVSSISVFTHYVTHFNHRLWWLGWVTTLLTFIERESKWKLDTIWLP
jgi:hypothetical protein